MGSKKILLKNKKNNYKLGFTLVEVLTVLVIIGIILAITIPNVSKLMHNENDKKLSALISSALKASNVYIDTYKKSFVDTYDKYNFKYESLLTTNLVKEEDIHCTGTMQATRKKNNNYTYNAYLMCKDKKGNVIYDNTSDLPEGGVSIFGKFLIDYVVRINNQSGEYYNHQYTKENVYNEYTAYDLERPGTSAGISKFMYSYNNKDWIDLNADSNSGVGSFTLTNTYVGNIYFKAYDLVGNESETINYQVKIDKIAPSGTVSIQSTDNRYNSLNVKVNLSATDNEKGSGVSKMCIQESSDVNSCSWENYKTSKNMMLSGSLDGKSRTLYAWYKDSVGNISNISDESAKASYTTYKEGTEVIYPNGFGACSVSCGGGLKTNEAVDKYTNKKIPEKNKYESCNNQGCCTSTYISSYGTCSKTCGGGVKQVYRKSNYNNQNCTNSSEKVTCNTQSCSPTLVRIGDALEEGYYVPLNSSQKIKITNGINYLPEIGTYNNSWVKAQVLTLNSNGTISYGPVITLKNGSDSCGDSSLRAVRVNDNTFFIAGGSLYRSTRSNSYYGRFCGFTVRVNGTSMSVINGNMFQSGQGKFYSVDGIEHFGNSTSVQVNIYRGYSNYDIIDRYTFNTANGGVTKENSTKNPGSYRTYDVEGMAYTPGWDWPLADYMGMGDGTTAHLQYANRTYRRDAGIYISPTGAYGINTPTIPESVYGPSSTYGSASAFTHLGVNKIIVKTTAATTNCSSWDYACEWRAPRTYKVYLHFLKKVNGTWIREHVIAAPGNGVTTTAYAANAGNFMNGNSNFVYYNIIGKGNPNHGLYVIHYN